MSEILLFCHPKLAYRGLPESEVAESYTDNLVDGLVSLVDFTDDYTGSRVEAEFQSVVCQKGGVDQILSMVSHKKKFLDKSVELSVFLDLPVRRIGTLRTNTGSLLLSIYSYNPEFSGEDFLPDLDVFVFKGDSAVPASEFVNDLYVNNGWTTSTSGVFIDYRLITPKGSRFINGLYILDPYLLREEANKLINYDLSNLYF